MSEKTQSSDLSHFRQASPRANPGEAEQIVPLSTGSPVRGLCIGLVGVAILSWIIPYVDAFLQASPLASNYLPTGVFLIFLGLLGINTVLRRSRWGLTRQEIMLAYITMLVPSAIPTEGLATRLTSGLVGMWYYATPTNEWMIFFPRYVPEWLTPNDANVVTWFFEGMPAGETVPYGPWIGPLTWWTLLILSLYLILTALTIIMRRQWMDAERLQYPLAQIPLTIMGDDIHPSWAGRFFRNRVVWIAAAIPFLLHMVNGLHIYYPIVPELLPHGLHLGTVFSGATFLRERPFNVLYGLQINFYWSVIGISYLLRAEVSLSVWVFEWLYMLEKMVFHAVGLDDGTHQWSPLHTVGHTLTSRYQKVGGILLAAAFYLYLARGRIRELCRAALGRSTGIVRGEPPYEGWVIWGLLGGTAFFLGWLNAAGMSILVAVALVVMFVSMCIVAARIIAATGLLWVYDYYVPMHGVSKVVGTARIDPQSYTIVGYTDFIALFHRSNIMPQEGDSFRLAQSTGIRTGHVLIGIFLGILVACAVSYYSVLNLAYEHGGLNLQRGMFQDLQKGLWNRIADRRRYQLDTNWTVVGLMTGGAGLMAGFIYLYRHFLWWPLYPLMFLFGDTRASNQLWFPVFLGWLLKTLAQRSGGHHTYTWRKPAALGLLRGERVAIALWSIVSAITGHVGHKVFPNFSPS
ncbi:MAG: hypothetical protein QGH20_03810 [Candidatus Latescibacteria bacterium]|nr:hypothetical protein [Candidatus Latescibacterota bacterium]